MPVALACFCNTDRQLKATMHVPSSTDSRAEGSRHGLPERGHTSATPHTDVTAQRLPRPKLWFALPRLMGACTESASKRCSTSVGSVLNHLIMEARFPFSARFEPRRNFLSRNCRSLEPASRARHRIPTETLASHALLNAMSSRTKCPELGSVVHQMIKMTRSLFHGCQAAGGVGAGRLKTGSSQSETFAQS